MVTQMTYESSDPHLNLFRRFGLSLGSQEYENNVTHALINTLRLTDPRVTRSLLMELVPELRSIPTDWTDIGWGLQRPPRSPETFQHRLVLAVSADGYAPVLAADRIPQDPQPIIADSGGAESISPDEDQSRGIPDAWIYTKQSNTLCILIEVKTRGGIDADQILRHEHTHFGPRGATLKNLDLRWKALSHAIDRAYRDYPSTVTSELLSFLSLEGLAATLRFDDATIHFAQEKLPKDVTDDLANRLRTVLGLGPEQVITWPDWQPYVVIFRSFEAVGNIEIWLDGEPPDVNVRTLISVGTATPRHNHLSMPEQIERLLENLDDKKILSRCINAIRAIDPPPFWTVLDRLQRAQMPDWGGRNADKIVQLLRAADRTADPETTQCFGEDHRIPGHELDRVARGLRSVHRAGQIQGGEFSGFRIFGRAYLGDLLVPAYGRSPQDVVAQVTEHCIRWHRILRNLSGVE